MGLIPEQWALYIASSVLYQVSFQASLLQPCGASYVMQMSKFAIAVKRTKFLLVYKSCIMVNVFWGSNIVLSKQPFENKALLII